MSDNPLDGITFHDVPVEEKIVNDEMDKTTKEALAELNDEVRNKKRIIYHDIDIPKINSKKGKEDRNERTSIVTQSRINMDYMKVNLGNCKSLRNGVIAVLLTGKELKTLHISEILKKEAPNIKAKKDTTSIASALTALLKNKEFSRILIKKDISTNRGGKLFSYRMNSAATELTLAEAISLANMRSTKTSMRKLSEKHPELLPFVSNNEIATEKVVKKIPIEQKEVKTTTDLNNIISDMLPKYLEETIKNKLGIEVTVRGNVSILFGFIGDKNS